MPMPEPLAIVRAVHFAACLAALGTAAFMLLVGRLDGLDRQFRRFAAAALAVALLSGVLWFALVAARILALPVSEALGDGGLISVVTDTRFGRIAIIRLALVVLAAAALALPRGRWPAVGATTALTGAIAWTGHAGAGTGLLGAVHLISDVAHLIAASLWLGGLPAFASLLVWSRGAPAPGDLAARVTRRFSLLAIGCVLALLTSGIINSAVLLGWPTDLLASAYGRVLVLKLALFAAMLGLAAFNRYRLTSRLPGRGALDALAGTTLVETVLGLGILVLVGILGTLAPASHLHKPTAAINPDAAFVHIHTEVVMADLTIDPGYAGTSAAIIRLWHEDYAPFAANRVQLALDPTFSGAAGIQHDARQLPDGTWVIENLRIQSPGVWTARVIIERKGTATVLDAPIVITQCSNECR